MTRTYKYLLLLSLTLFLSPIQPSLVKASETTVAALVNEMAIEGFSPEETEEIKDALRYLGQIKTVLPSEGIIEVYPILNGRIDGEEILRVITSYVKHIKKDIDHCADGSSACTRYGSDQIYVNCYHLKAAVLQSKEYFRAAYIYTILHEAYHLVEDGKEPHTRCEYGRLGCDSNLAGAYGFSSYTMWNIGKYCTNCDKDFRISSVILGMFAAKHLLNNGNLFMLDRMNEDCPTEYTQEANDLATSIYWWTKPKGYPEDDPSYKFPLCNYKSAAAPKQKHKAKDLHP